MNLVLHRSQVALNVDQFDITEQVAEQLNKVLASVVIPPDGVSPATLAKATDKATPAAAPASAGSGLGSGLGSDSGSGETRAGAQARACEIGAMTAGDPRFFARSGPHPLAAVAAAAGAEMAEVPEGDAAAAETLLHGIAPLQSAGPDDVSFLDNRRYADALAATQAGAVIVHPDMAGRVPAGTRRAAGARALCRLGPRRRPLPSCRRRFGRACTRARSWTPKRVVDPSAEIGPLAVIGARAEIGARCRIGPAAVIGDGGGARADCRVGAHA